MHSRLALAGAIFILAGMYPAASHAARPQAGGTLTFRVTVSGKAHDRGTIAVAIQPGKGADVDFNGCAIVTQSAAKSILGAQTLEIHLNYAGGTNLMIAGSAPFVPHEIYMRLSQFHPTVSTYSYKKDGPVDLAFVINGHVYGSPARTTVHIANGGQTGSVSGLDALRLYPGSRTNPLHGVNLNVTWKCSTMLHSKA